MTLQLFLSCSALKPELAEKLRMLINIHGPIAPKSRPTPLSMPGLGLTAGNASSVRVFIFVNIVVVVVVVVVCWHLFAVFSPHCLLAFVCCCFFIVYWHLLLLFSSLAFVVFSLLALFVVFFIVLGGGGHLFVVIVCLFV